MVEVEAGVDDRQRHAGARRFGPVRADPVEVPADRGRRERVRAGEVGLACDRPVRLGEAQGAQPPKPRDQPLRRVARKPPDVEVGGDDRAAVRGDQTLGGGVRANAEHGVPEVPERRNLAVGRNLRSGSRLRRCRRSYEEQRQDDPKPAHQQTR